MRNRPFRMHTRNSTLSVLRNAHKMLPCRNFIIQINTFRRRSNSKFRNASPIKKQKTAIVSLYQFRGVIKYAKKSIDTQWMNSFDIMWEIRTYHQQCFRVFCQQRSSFKIDFKPKENGTGQALTQRFHPGGWLMNMQWISIEKIHSRKIDLEKKPKIFGI